MEENLIKGLELLEKFELIEYVLRLDENEKNLEIMT
jgi:hypothetical protein